MSEIKGYQTATNKMFKDDIHKNKMGFTLEKREEKSNISLFFWYMIAVAFFELTRAFWFLDSALILQ